MTDFITTYFDWLVNIINVINAQPLYNVLFLIPVLYLIIMVAKKFMS